MPHFKDSQDKLYWLDDGVDPIQWLPQDCIQITEEETEAIRTSQLPPPPDPADIIKNQIAQLEKEQLLPRITREFMLLQFAAVAASQGVDPTTNYAYNKLKELDDQIAVLRTQL